MNENMIPSLKLIYKPLIMYYGEWELLDGLDKIAVIKNGKNLYEEFLERYYYMPLKVIFKDDALVRSLKLSICSRLGENGRSLYFSKKALLRNLIANADEIIDNGGKEVYKDIKKAIRVRKDVYRDVINCGEESQYYNEVNAEYENLETDMSFDEYVSICKKKYTRLLTGYNAVLDLFDKPISVNKFIKLFDFDQLYLFTIYSVLRHSEKQYELYGKVDYNITVIDSYRKLVNETRKDNSFYNTHIDLGDDKVYTIDDLFKEYDELLDRVNGK